MGLIYEEETKVLRQCLFEVQNEVGLGRREEAYHRACKSWLEKHGVPFRSKPPCELKLGGELAHVLYPDFVCWDSICLELKALPRKLVPSEFVQLFDYLKCRGDQLGLLANLGLDRVHVERIVFERQNFELHEDWNSWSDHIADDERKIGIRIRKALQAAYAEHTTGYGEEVAQKLIEFALRQQSLRIASAPTAKAWFDGNIVDESPIDCLVVEEKLVLVLTALFDDNQFNISRGLSFMKALNLQWGVAANFGKKCAQFNGLRG